MVSQNHWPQRLNILFPLNKLGELINTVTKFQLQIPDSHHCQPFQQRACHFELAILPHGSMQKSIIFSDYFTFVHAFMTAILFPRYVSVPIHHTHQSVGSLMLSVSVWFAVHLVCCISGSYWLPTSASDARIWFTQAGDDRNSR